ncbi:prepilin-type N-terminal cleavage/methylation domain-containing protein [Paucibacter sp. APW11]|uniref:Prepilin-type N-terminal cleavage/methylation domain-containing protein n=1 Tax=Roseateles aquae TaxID=3077235 RepID=A0ABU3P822_9BURK|nr:prepilin-type N-terminal cleavage/methylation domain-containing protein [Paucibacter sp. APW11]MDT8998725.1 prepilin-type N-terminal cleavage/methylation domain-containing protein [Paucibacter sp. APW11]
MPAAARRASRGITLVEALVAMLIMAFGMVALSGMQTALRRGADLGKQRTDAMRVAQAEIDQLRSFTTITATTPPTAGVFAYSNITQDLNLPAVTVNATSFSVSRAVTDLSNPPRKNVVVTVTWTDRANEQQSVSLYSMIAPLDPKISGALRFAPNSTTTRRPLERSPDIPAGAKDLGSNYSAAAPPGTSGVFWLFDNTTGRITGICAVPGVSLVNLSSGDVTNCQTNVTGGAYLVSGFIRFSTGVTADPDSPSSAALPLSVDLNVTSTSTVTPKSTCYDDSAQAVAAGQTWASYMCIVYPDGTHNPPDWDGRTNLNGLTLAAGGQRVCRYSADYNGNGSIDNAEHPLNYSAVPGSLSKQNFLVIAYANTCPAGTPASPSSGRYINTATVAHQP